MMDLISSYSLPIALLTVILGLLVAAALSWSVGYALQWLNRKLRQLSPTATVLSSTAIKLIRRTVYAVIIVLFGLFALRVGGLAELLDPAFAILPGFIAGALVILLGYLAATFIYEILNATFVRQGGSTSIPRVIQTAVVVVAVLTGLTTMSIDVSFFGQSILILLVVSLGGMSLAFALGSRTYINNLLARRVFREFSVGDRIRLEKLEGVILEFTSQSVLLKTEEGIAIIPASLMAESVVIRLMES